MKPSAEIPKNLYFLSGGGEMGALVRAFDWSKTPLGDPQGWCQSLCTSVAIMLDNPFGMYIAWGSAYIQIYNDGYRPILGSTKHPQALGISTKETFAEIWHIIGPMFEGVMNGKAVGFQDFMLPLNRNGYIEECYFDFSYSPIRIETGEVGGVLVTVIETTSKKKAVEALRESEIRFRTMVDNIAQMAFMTHADGWIYWYNKKWYDYTGTTPAQMEGWGWQSVHDPNYLPIVNENWKTALASGEPFEMIFPLKGADGQFRQFLTRVHPFRDEEGIIYQWFGTNTDITERIEAEQMLKESEQRFRTMAEATNVLIAVGDQTGNAKYFNKAWIDFTGRPMEELVEFGWADLVNPNNGDDIVTIYLEAFKNRESFTSEYQMLNAKGEYRWLIVNSLPRFDSNGSFSGYISSNIDITERKNAERALKESEKNLRNTILKAPVAMCLFRGDNHVVELANERMLIIWGKSGEEVMGKPIFEGIPEAKNQGFEELMDDVYKTGNTFSAQGIPVTLFRNNKTEKVYINLVYEAYREANGVISGIICVAIDVTDQVKATKVVEDAFSRFKTMSDAMPQIVWTATPDGNLDFFSKQWREYSGLNFEQSVGAGWASTIHSEDIAELIAKWTYSLQTGEPYQSEARVRRFDGIYRWFLIRALAIKENETIVQWVGTCTDLQDQKYNEQELHSLSSQLAAINEELTSSNEELNDTNQQLKLINSDLDNFIYTASHDLKAPISNIEGLMTVLKGTLPEEIIQLDEVEMITSLIDTSIERFKRTINQLTDITQLQKEFKLELTDVLLAEVIKEVELDLQILINQMGAVLEIDSNTNRSIHFSQKNLRSIVYNLISNAVKYSSSERSPLIKISCSQTDQYYILSISDNGLGIDLSNESKLFAMFGRLHDHVEGSGVGLYIVKKMLDNAGGKIEVESKVGVGSTFKVHFKNEIKNPKVKF